MGQGELRRAVGRMREWGGCRGITKKMGPQDTRKH